MALQPCGTVAAYKRHRRRNEEPCQACKDANTDKARARRQAKQQADAAQVAEVIEPTEVLDAVEETAYDPLTDAKENLRLVKETMTSGLALPQMAALSRRRQELIDYIAELESKDEESQDQGVSVFDELAKRRREREGQAAATG